MTQFAMNSPTHLHTPSCSVRHHSTLKGVASTFMLLKSGPVSCSDPGDVLGLALQWGSRGSSLLEDRSPGGGELRWLSRQPGSTARPVSEAILDLLAQPVLPPTQVARGTTE